MRVQSGLNRRVDPLQFDGVVGFRSTALPPTPAPEIAAPELLRPLCIDAVPGVSRKIRAHQL
jgi:hypothetical protein